MLVDATKLASDLQPLYRAAEEARAQSYSPYSGFAVGAAILTSEGKIVTGANIENASYGLTICAERVALFRAIVEGHRKMVAVAIAARADTAAPCGACRQVLAEFNGGISIVFPLDGRLAVIPLQDLLPHGFGRENITPGA